MGFISDLLINVSAFRIKIGEKLNTLVSRIGNLPSLNTTDKSNLVNAINEVNSNSSSSNPKFRRVVLDAGGYVTTGTLRIDLGRAIQGWLRIRLTGIYHTYNMSGYIEVVGGVMSNNNALYEQSLRCVVSNGLVRNKFAIDTTIKRDVSTGQLYIELFKKQAPSDRFYVDIEYRQASNNITATSWNPVVHSFTEMTPPALINEVTLFGNLDVQGSGGITTLNHGNSSQWKQAYDWGNFRDFGLGVNIGSHYGSWSLTSGYTSFIASSDHGSSLAPSTSALFGFKQMYAGSFGGEIGYRNNRIGFRTMEANVLDSWNELYHSGNFNPSNYALLSQVYTQTQVLGLFVGLNGVQTIAGTKTFSSSPIVPNGTLNGHTVNLGQLNSAIAGVTYTLPIASATVRGGVELGSDTVQTIASNAVSATASRSYAVQLNSAGQMIVNVPWTNTTFTAGVGITQSGYEFSMVVNSSGSAGVNKYVSAVTQESGGIKVTYATLPEVSYILPTASSTVKGGVELFSDVIQTVSASTVSAVTSRTYGVQLNSAGQMVVNVPWSDSNTVTQIGANGGNYSFGDINFEGINGVSVSKSGNTVTISGNGGGSGVPSARTIILNDSGIAFSPNRYKTILYGGNYGDECPVYIQGANGDATEDGAEIIFQANYTRGFTIIFEGHEVMLNGDALITNINAGNEIKIRHGQQGRFIWSTDYNAYFLMGVDNIYTF